MVALTEGNNAARGRHVKLAASLVVRNELARYLRPCIEHLLTFCDQVVVLDDASDDGSREYLIDHPDERLHVVTQATSTFYVHEGQTRNLLLDETLVLEPTHVLSIDADEFISNPIMFRANLQEHEQVEAWSLTMEEVWTATPTALCIREDGGWRSHELPYVWKPPAERTDAWRMLDRKLSTRRVPIAVLNQAGRARKMGCQILHFGWTDPATRQARYDRYAQHDGGRFHASRHLLSILAPPARVRLREREWPEDAVFDRLRDMLTEEVAA